MKTKRFKAEFLSKEETKALKEFNLSVRQLEILDIMKSYHITTNNNGRFTLSTVQLAEQIKVTTRTLEKDIISLIGKGVLEKTKVKVKGVKWLVNEYFVPLFNMRKNSEEISHINPLNTKELEALLTPLINTRKNSVEISHSNSISNSKSNNTTIVTNTKETNIDNTTIVTKEENKEEKTIDNMENNNTYTVELTVDNFKIITDDITQITEDVIDEVVEKFNYIQSRIGRTTELKTISKVTTEVEEELEEVGDTITIEDKNTNQVDNNTNQVEETNTTNSNTEGRVFSGVGTKIIDRIKEKKLELFKVKFNPTDKSRCFGNGDLARFPKEIEEELEKTQGNITSKQADYINKLLEEYTNQLQNKVENMQKYCTKSRSGEVKVLGVNRVDETKKEYDQAAKELLRNSFNRALESGVKEDSFNNGVYNYLQGFALSTAEKNSIRAKIAEEYSKAKMVILREERLKKTTPTTETKVVVEEETKANSSSIFNFRNLGLEEIEKSREEALDEICKTSRN